MKNHRLLFPLLFAATVTFAQVPYPGNDAELGVTRSNGFIDPYTGNLTFQTKDLVVSGAVGGLGLSWRRYATSRTSPAEQLFGLGHNWGHNWQWEMVDAGKDSQGRAVLSVHVPRGWVERFTEISPGEWGTTPGVRDRLTVDGDSFVLTCWGAKEVHFAREHTEAGDVFSARQMTDEIGNVWSLAWKSGRLVQVTEPAGRWLKISYKTMAAPNRAAGTAPFTVIDHVTASDGQRVAYTYEFPATSDYPVLASVSYPDGTVAHYTYTEPRPGARALLVQAVDPRGDRRLRGCTFHYRSEPGAALGQVLDVRASKGGTVLSALAADSRGSRSYAVTQDNGAIAYRTFNPGGNVAVEIDALGFARKYDYDADGRGFEIAVTDKLGNIKRYENDANGQIVKTTYPDGTSRIWRRDAKGRVLAETDELGYTRTYTRDRQGRVTKVQYPGGATEETTYNAFGQPLTRRDRGGAVTTFAYDERGLRTKVTNALGFTTTTGYDAQDRVASVTDPRGNTPRYERDAAGRVVKTTFADGATTATDYDDFGQVTKKIDALGAARTYVYDDFGRRTSTFDALGNETRTEYGSAASGAPVGRPVRAISPSGRVTAMSYDADGRLVARTLAAGTAEAATTRFAYDPAGRQVSIANPLGNVVQFFYDQRGRRTKSMSALNHATTWTYDGAGRKLTETDPKGNTTQWTYDALGRELTKTDALKHTTTRTYDAAGRLATLTDAKGSTYRFEYNALGRPTALVYPDGSRETTAYDGAGNKQSYTNRAGAVQTFHYDVRNREITSEWSDGSQKIVKAYDVAGRMTLEDDGVSRLSYTFDAAGRLASETQDLSPLVTGGAIDPAPRTVTYTYTADGQRETLGYPDGTSVKLAYNARGQLQDILGDGVPPPIASYEYDLAGNATQMPRENQTETVQRHDAENRVTGIVEHGPDRSPLAALDYTYDEAGNRTSTTTTDYETTTGHRTTTTRDTYLYDDTYQVTGADYRASVAVAASQRAMTGTPASSVRFIYDAVGNRIEVADDGAVTRYSVIGLNQYTQVGDFTAGYDRNGNLAAMGQWLYQFDALNRLVSASNGTMTAKFFYDAKNRCVARSYNSSLTFNYYDKWNLIDQFDMRGVQTARYVHGRRIDEIVLIVNKHGVFYPHHDPLGNITMLTGASGRLIERYNYSIEGKVEIQDAAGHSLPSSAVGNPWLFTGRERLPYVGLYDYRNRIYSSDLARFFQTDPIRFSASDINIY